MTWYQKLLVQLFGARHIIWPCDHITMEFSSDYQEIKGTARILSEDGWKYFIIQGKQVESWEGK